MRSEECEGVACEYDLNVTTSISPEDGGTGNDKSTNDKAVNEFSTNDRHCVLQTALIWLVDFFHPPGSGRSKDFTIRCTVASHILTLTKTYNNISEFVFPQIPTKALLSLSKSLNTFYRANPNDPDAEWALRVGLAMCKLGKERTKDDSGSESLLAVAWGSFNGLLQRRNGGNSKYREGEHDIDPPEQGSAWCTWREAMQAYNEYRYFGDNSNEDDVALDILAGMDEKVGGRLKGVLKGKKTW